MVLLLTGPAGSGKTTLAHELGERLGWTVISEDDYWVRNGWGSGLRTREQEGVIQQHVLADVVSICRSGGSVVLEFILYSEPPNPLSAYTEALSRESLEVAVIALKPSVAEIERRMARRGRPQDLDQLDQRRADAERQLRILDSEPLRSVAFDTTGQSVEEVAQLCLDTARLRRDRPVQR